MVQAKQQEGDRMHKHLIHRVNHAWLGYTSNQHQHTKPRQLSSWLRSGKPSHLSISFITRAVLTTGNCMALVRFININRIITSHAGCSVMPSCFEIQSFHGATGQNRLPICKQLLHILRLSVGPEFMQRSNISSPCKCHLELEPRKLRPLERRPHCSSDTYSMFTATPLWSLVKLQIHEHKVAKKCIWSKWRNTRNQRQSSHQAHCRG